MTTQSASRPTAATRGGRTGERVGRCSGRTGGRSSNQGDGKNDGPGCQVGGQGSKVNDGVGRVPEFSTIIAQQEFLACNPKEYDDKGGVIVYTRWIKKMELI
ncbi:hypothetical protein Tco_0297061 [Tanacetum coccineum]